MKEREGKGAGGRGGVAFLSEVLLIGCQGDGLVQMA